MKQKKKYLPNLQCCRRKEIHASGLVMCRLGSAWKPPAKLSFSRPRPRLSTLVSLGELHPVIQTPIIAGGFRENADLHIFMPAPDPILFRVVNRTLGIILPPAFDIYWIQWSHNYDIVVGGLVWETFIYQEQLSRSTMFAPLNQHNLLNDDLQDIPVEDNNDDEDDEDDDEDEDL